MLNLRGQCSFFKTTYFYYNDDSRAHGRRRRRLDLQNPENVKGKTIVL